MPGFTTHYLFGVNTYKKINDTTLQKTIFENHAAYSLGLQGPDIFFYYLPYYLSPRHNIGSISHAEDTRNFLRHLINSPSLFQNQKETSIAKAYILGFIGHYILDCACHPYIYYRTHYNGKTKDYYGRHMNLETDIDTVLLSIFKHKLPSAFQKESVIALTKLQLNTISSVLYYVYSKTYPRLHVHDSTMTHSIRSMQLGVKLLHDPQGKKKIIVRKIEALTAGYPILSPMIASDYLQFYSDPLNILGKEWKNPWDTSRTSDASFLDLMAQAQEDYLRLLKLLHRLFIIPESMDMKASLLLKILNILGNKSYHSGLAIRD